MSDEERRERDRQHIQESLQENEETEGSVVIGWVTIAEVMAPDGRTWLCRQSGDARNEALPQWREKGYLIEYLMDGLSHGEDE